MIRVGVFAAIVSLLFAGVPAVSVLAANGATSSETQLLLDARHRGVILTEEAITAYRASMPSNGRLDQHGAIAGGILGNVIAGSIARQAGRSRMNAEVDDHSGVGDLNSERMARATIRASIGGFLDALANIRLKVRPAPPRDYIVKINGRPYPASERSIYAIPPGIVQVSVSRKGKSPCHWAGTVSADTDKVLNCKL